MYALITPATGDRPLFCEVTSIDSGIPGVTEFRVIWGDGSPDATGDTLIFNYASHTYTAVGTYNLVVEAIDSEGNVVDGYIQGVTVSEAGGDTSTTTTTTTTTTTPPPGTTTTTTTTTPPPGTTTTTTPPPGTTTTTSTTTTTTTTTTTAPPIGPPGCQPCLPAPLAPLPVPDVVLPTTQTAAPVVVTTTPTPDSFPLNFSGTTTTTTTTLPPETTTTTTTTQTTPIIVGCKTNSCNKLGY